MWPKSELEESAPNPRGRGLMIWQVSDGHMVYQKRVSVSIPQNLVALATYLAHCSVGQNLGLGLLWSWRGSLTNAQLEAASARDKRAYVGFKLVMAHPCSTWSVSLWQISPSLFTWQLSRILWESESPQDLLGSELVRHHHFHSSYWAKQVTKLADSRRRETVPISWWEELDKTVDQSLHPS